MFYSEEDSARFTNDLSTNMRCILTQIARLAVAPALETGHDCSGGFNNEELVSLAKAIDACSKHSRLGLREINGDLVFSYYDKNKVPESFTMLANGHSSLNTDTWEGYVIAGCIKDEDMFIFIGDIEHVRSFCSDSLISIDSLGIVGIKLGNSMMAPVHTNNANIDHDAFVFVG